MNCLLNKRQLIQLLHINRIDQVELERHTQWQECQEFSSGKTGDSIITRIISLIRFLHLLKWLIQWDHLWAQS